MPRISSKSPLQSQSQSGNAPGRSSIRGPAVGTRRLVRLQETWASNSSQRSFPSDGARRAQE